MTDTDARRLAHAQTPRGELVLRRRSGVLELISNGTFLMDTANGESERALADLSLAGLAGRPRVLVAGLGFGFTLARTLSFDVTEVVLVELEPDVVRWNREWWALGREALADDRVRIVIADFAEYVRTAGEQYDAVLVDIDNGPDWTVAEPNDSLYAAALADLRRIVRVPDGRLGVWSASESDSFHERLCRHFGQVSVHEISVPRGSPDVVYVAGN